jgi:hypothetical protein
MISEIQLDRTWLTFLLDCTLAANIGTISSALVAIINIFVVVKVDDLGVCGRIVKKNGFKVGKSWFCFGRMDTNIKAVEISEMA